MCLEFEEFSCRGRGRCDSLNMMLAHHIRLCYYTSLRACGYSAFLIVICIYYLYIHYVCMLRAYYRLVSGPFYFVYYDLYITKAVPWRYSYCCIVVFGCRAPRRHIILLRIVAMRLHSIYPGVYCAYIFIVFILFICCVMFCFIVMFAC